jgi:hypothetical protein
VFGTCRGKNEINEKKSWQKMIRCYIDILHYLRLEREYVDGELDHLEELCDELDTVFVEECGGMANVTNYFHDIISGHVVQVSRMWGNLWKLRNENVEALNAIVSRRRNCFSNLGGAKRSKTGQAKRRFMGVESLGNWCLRTAGWLTGIAV